MITLIKISDLTFANTDQSQAQSKEAEPVTSVVAHPPFPKIRSSKIC